MMSARDANVLGHVNKSSAPFGVFARKQVTRRATDVEAEPKSISLQTLDAWPDDALEVGVIIDSYGLKGWVKVIGHASAAQRGDALMRARHWWLAKGQDRKSLSVLNARVHGDNIIAHLANVGDREGALALRGYRVYVRRSEFPALSADEFYWVDLLGLDVVNNEGIALGQVVGLIDNGAHAVLRVEYPNCDKAGLPANGERLIPFVSLYVKQVEQAKKRIIVDWQTDY